MSKQIGSDLLGVLKGLQMITNEFIKIQENYVKHTWANSSIKSVIQDSRIIPPNLSSIDIEKFRNEALQRSSMVVIGVRVFADQLKGIKTTDNIFGSNAILNKDKTTENIMKLTPLAVENLRQTADNVNLQKKSETVKEFTTSKSDEPIIRKERKKLSDLVDNSVETPKKNSIEKFEQTVSESAKASEVPSSQTSQVIFDEKKKLSNLVDNPMETPKEKNIEKFAQSLSESAKATKVPSSRIGRMFSFGSLAAGLGIGTVAEVARRTLGLQQTAADNPFLTPANAERIVSTLCKVRGAALKIGQILSIQDNNVISPELQKAFERVRQAADFMPSSQVEKVMRSQLGPDWKSKFLKFEMKPFAAASIGQVHYGVNRNGVECAVKIQYPGVAQGINSDIENLVGVLNLWNIFPEGMFIDKVVEVAKKELAWEVDYVREAQCTKKFKKLLTSYPDYYVPDVIDDLSSKEVFTTELVHGIPVDKCIDLDEESKLRICKLILNLCLQELFEFRYMQTDPNWSNFFYNQNTGKLILLDFGATRSYDKPFMDKYIKVIKAAADGNRQEVLQISRDMGFLTGFESKAMEEAHIDTVMILGEVFSDRYPEFDFGRQDTILRVTKLVPTILQHRLCPPPEEIYSLHRKLSGVFLLCTKLGVKMKCREMFVKVYNSYVFN
ncbi:hypothetical protein O3M35_004799 [Rhynocoris fuscipes]|uniref:ABC1 atypical kinase-like domain-containing protein n=1 Tax=Rhynocoris fuscipes TaxID=488301 RepID=A0AAW1DG70_9HEMI